MTFPIRNRVRNRDGRNGSKAHSSLGLLAAIALLFATGLWAWLGNGADTVRSVTAVQNTPATGRRTARHQWYGAGG